MRPAARPRPSGTQKKTEGLTLLPQKRGAAVLQLQPSASSATSCSIDFADLGYRCYLYVVF
jgi:hypothetical protein